MNIKKTIVFLLFFIPFFLLYSCGNKKEKPAEYSSSPDSNELTVSPVSQLVMERGLSVYKTHCFACHLMDGSGIKGLYPPLAGNETVTGEKPHLIGILLNGMSGEIEVNGEKYNQVMVPHDFLTDNQIASVLTYIRNSFGNQADEVKTAEVKLIRKKMNLIK